VKAVKAVFYWLSIILPLIDGVRGVRDGIKKSGEDLLNDVKNAQQKRLWEEANKPTNDEE